VFSPRLRVEHHRWIGRRSVRALLAGGLCVLLGVILLPARASITAGIAGRVRNLRVSGRPQGNETVTQEPKPGSVHSFVIQMVDGVARCRKATAAEVPATLPRREDRGVPVRDLLQGENQTAVYAVGNSSTGLTINLIALSQLQSDSNRNTVIAAFQRAAANWTTRIKSPVTIRINIDYGVNRPNGSAFPDGVLGSTSAGSVSVDYPMARSRLVASASNTSEVAIYNALPSSVVPTNTGDGSVVEVSRSLAQPLGLVPLNPNETVATISFNKNFAFDFNPDNGVDFDKVDFDTVATHEIGHALGFVSNAGGDSTAQVSLWDIFRFRPGITTNTFTTAQRIMSVGGSQVYFTGQPFSVEFSSTDQLRLSTGGPDGSGGDGNQSSHWKDDDLTGEYIGIMDPNVSSGIHEDTTENDYSALETLGWNLLNNAAPPLPPPPPSNDDFANARNVTGCSASVIGTILNASKEAGEPNHSPDNNGGTHSVWYQWQAPGNGTATFTTAGSAYDTVLAVYTGTSVNALTLIGKNDDIPDVPGQPHNVTSSVTFTAAAGTIYLIAIDGYNNGGSGGDMGPLKLNWSESNCTEPPPSLLIEQSTIDRAVALDSVTFVRGPFRILSNLNLSTDHHTRVMLFTSNLGLEPGENLSVLSVQAAGVSLPVEAAGTVRGLSQASYIIVRLPDGLATGDLPISVTLRGATSNVGKLGISP